VASWPGADGPPEKAGVMGSQEFFLPFAQGNFRTPSGKANYIAKRMKALGPRSCGRVHSSIAIRHGVDNATFPLELLARKADQFPELNFLQPAFGSRDGKMWTSGNAAADARARGIVDGAKVRVTTIVEKFS